MTFDSITLGSIHDCVEWFRETSVQLVTAPATLLFLMIKCILHQWSMNQSQVVEHKYQVVSMRLLRQLTLPIY